jgi:hypothetical protein
VNVGPIANGYSRQCPGQLLAEDVIFIACAMSIAAFDIQKKVKNGALVEPVRRMVPGIVKWVNLVCYLFIPLNIE